MKQNIVWRGLSWTALLLLLVSIALNVVLYSQLRKYYAWLYAVELDPLGLSHFENAANEKSLSESPTFVFYGDSRAAQWDQPTLEGFQFINRGIGNQTTAQVALRFEADIAPLQPDIILIQVGINDLKTIPLFPERKQEIIDDCKANIGKMIEDSLRLNARVLLTTIFPVGEVPLQRRLVWSDDIQQAVVEVNDHLRSLASEDVIVFDAAALLSDASGKMRPEYRDDELHLNDAGYEALNAELISLLGNIQHESE